jgi:predicted MFS family arabinose efflux permease
VTPDSIPSPLRPAQLAALPVVRTVINTGFRMVYPFLPALARGLGVDIGSIALAVTARSSLGLLAPFIGSAADARSRKSAMLLGLGLFAGAMMMVVAWPTYPSFFAALSISAAGKILFDASMQAYLGERVDYGRRGMAIAISELGWSGAFMLGMPAVGWLISRAGWNAPFPWLAGLALASAIVLQRVLPADPASSRMARRVSQGLRLVLRHGPALAGLGVSLLISTANEVINIVYGVWMEGTFGLQVIALGAASAVIGLSELTGEGLVAGFADRLGKRWAVGIGILLGGAASLALPLLGTTLTGSLVGLFLFYVCFEFTLVTGISLMTEIAPQARTTLMASNLSAHALGRALGAALGPALFSWGLLANGAGAAFLNLVALALLVLFVREQTVPIG